MKKANLKNKVVALTIIMALSLQLGGVTPTFAKGPKNQKGEISFKCAKNPFAPLAETIEPAGGEDEVSSETPRDESAKLDTKNEEQTPEDQEETIVEKTTPEVETKSFSENMKNILTQIEEIFAKALHLKDIISNFLNEPDVKIFICILEVSLKSPLKTPVNTESVCEFMKHLNQKFYDKGLTTSLCEQLFSLILYIIYAPKA